MPSLTEPTIETKNYYPEKPPALHGETDEEYTNRLTGADGTYRQPYNHHRFRQCSIGYHDECSANRSGDPACECPHHDEPPSTYRAIYLDDGDDPSFAQIDEFLGSHFSAQAVYNNEYDRLKAAFADAFDALDGDIVNLGHERFVELTALRNVLEIE